MNAHELTLELLSLTDAQCGEIVDMFCDDYSIRKIAQWRGVSQAAVTEVIRQALKAFTFQKAK